MYHFDLTNDSPTLSFEAHGLQGQFGKLKSGLWHLYLSQRPEDGQPTSWVVSEPQYGKLKTQHTSDKQITLSEEHRLNLQPFQWVFDSLELMDLSPLKQALMPPGKAQEPFEDPTDGLRYKYGFELTYHLPETMHFYGLGERTGFINKRGKVWKNWTTDEFIHTPQSDPLYQAHPFVMIQNKGIYYGLYLDEAAYSEFDLGASHPGQFSIRTAGASVSLYLIPGPTPSEVIKRYTKLVGRAPMPPLWPFGFHQCRWGYPTQSACDGILKAYDKHELPLTTLWLDIDHMRGYRVFQFSSARFPHPEELVAELQRNNRHLVVIADPGIKMDKKDPIYLSGLVEDIYIRNTQDEPLVGEVWPNPVVWPDFTVQNAQKWWGRQLENYYKVGVSGIWIDMNEPSSFHCKDKTLPLNARQGQWTHAQVHNLYGYLMAQATYQGSLEQLSGKRPFVLTRSGFSGIQKYAWIWTGDNHSYWEHLEMSIPMLLNMGLSGMPFVGADIGGFSAKCDGELLARWTWLGAFYPFMRNHSGKHSDRQEPWIYGEPYLSAIRKALKFRYHLLPYFYTLAREASLNGQPLMRPMFLEFPQDKETHQISDQFMLGSALMVAPILRPGQTTRAAYFPPGIWGRLGEPKLYRGGQYHLVSANIDEIPVFQRQDTALPMQIKMQTQSAQWALQWLVTAGAEQFSGQVYCDSGDGAVNAEMIRISGKVTQSSIQCEMPLFYPGRLLYGGQEFVIEDEFSEWSLTE